MASIRARLTAWNGGVLVVILLVFATAGYIFLRYATLAQIDRALRQQVRVVTLTAQAPHSAIRDGAATADMFVQDLRAHGVVVTLPAALPNTIVTAPARVEEDDGERRRQPVARRTATPDLDWKALADRIKTQPESDDAFSVRGARGGSRVLIEDVTVGPQRMMLIATQPLGELAELLETAQYAALIALPVAILLAIVSGYMLARRALDPVASMTVEARRIGARNLHERLSIRNPRDELGKLAVTFNDVLERVDLAMEQQRRFTADASHELRTPIALIRAEADVALSGSTAPGGNDESEYRAALFVIQDGSQQLSRIVNDLFLLARADAGQTMLTTSAMRLDEFLTSTVHGMRSLAEPKALELTVSVPGSVEFHGDEALLRRALCNLLDNAIKYSTGPATICVSLEQDDAAYHIVVTDTGCGISVEDRLHIFERFYRGDRTRGHRESAAGAGAGLGLAIAREIADLHGGSVELRGSSERGSSFELNLPIASRIRG